MRPPCCAVCSRTPADFGTYASDDFGVVEFCDFQPPDDDRAGGPWPGSDWFCRDHLSAAASAAAAGMTLAAALAAIG
ncbi:MAG TPA: hypothetical protein VGR90_06055 [Acidimicrobiales bacterium]|nr:hypothetical protein [Acidimicrobiales bacterium]